MCCMSGTTYKPRNHQIGGGVHVWVEGLNRQHPFGVSLGTFPRSSGLGDIDAESPGFGLKCRKSKCVNESPVAFGDGCVCCLFVWF